MSPWCIIQKGCIYTISLVATTEASLAIIKQMVHRLLIRSNCKLFDKDK